MRFLCTSIRILYSQCFVYIFKVLRLYRQSIASIYSKRFEYKMHTDNQAYTYIHVYIFNRESSFM